MDYRIFDIVARCGRDLPFREAAEEDEPDLEVVESSGSVGDDDELGVLRDGRYGFQYAGWRCACRTHDGVLAYASHPLGELELPLWHVLERMGIPIWLGIAGADLLVVHGSSVVLDGGGWLFIGGTGAGKSTTAYELMREHGAEIASDEMAVLDLGAGRLRPGAPALRLSPELGADALAEESGAIHPAIEKRWYRFPADRIADRAVPLRGIVVLRRAEAERDELPRGSLAGSERLTALLDQTFDFEETPSEWRERRFRNAARLAKQVPLYEFGYRPAGDGRPNHVESLRDFLRERDEP